MYNNRYNLNASYLPGFGDFYSTSVFAGCFSIYVKISSAAGSHASLGGRLIFLQEYFMYKNYSGLYASCLPIFGGIYSHGAAAGCFYLFVISSATDSSASLGGRLIFL